MGSFDGAEAGGLGTAGGSGDSCLWWVCQGLKKHREPGCGLVGPSRAGTHRVGVVGIYCRAVGGGVSLLVVGGGECRARTGYVARYSPAVRGVGRDWLTLTRDRRSSGGREDGVQQRLLVPVGGVCRVAGVRPRARGTGRLSGGRPRRVTPEAAFPAARGRAPVSGEVEDAYVSRLGYKVSARIVSGAGPAGRLAGFPGLWAVGR